MSLREHAGAIANGAWRDASTLSLSHESLSENGIMTA